MLQLGMYMQHGHCDMSPKSMHAHTQMSQLGNVTAGYVHAHTVYMQRGHCNMSSKSMHKCYSWVCTCSVGTATCHLKACTHTHKCYSWVCTCTSSCACSVGTATCQLNMDRPLTTGCNDLRLKNSQINDIVNHSSHHGRLGTPITFKVNTAQSVVVRLPDR